VSYITSGSSTDIRQIQITLSDNSVLSWPETIDASLVGTTSASLTLTGILIGFVIDINTSIFYVKQRYVPTLNPVTIPQFNYNLGDSALVQTITVTWPPVVPASASPASIYVMIDVTTNVTVSYTPPTTTLTLALLDFTQVNSNTAIGSYARIFKTYYDNVCSSTNSFIVSITCT
jgi:hypothetical protein